MNMRFSLILIPVLTALFFCFVTPVHSLDVTLAWNTDPAADGCKVYYKTGSSGPPYDGIGAAEGDSPIDVGWVSEFTLRALSEDEDHYFVVTAYNENGESGYSNEVTTAKSVVVSTVGAAGGDGGGCFISAITERRR
jgi:hypothetical protein